MSFFRRLRGGLETERLWLRRWRPGDFQGFLRFAADPEVTFFSGRKPVTSLREGEVQFRRALRDEGCYAIVLKDRGEVIGKIKFQKDARRSQANCRSIGYELAREHWGRGYMTEALAAMVRQAFEERGVQVLSVSHAAENFRSRRVIEKCGFHREDVLRQGFCRYEGAVFGDECYSILREEYFQNPERYSGRSPGNL